MFNPVGCSFVLKVTLDAKNFLRTIIKRKKKQVGGETHPPRYHPRFHSSSVTIYISGITKKKFSIKDAEYFMGLGLSDQDEVAGFLEGFHCFKQERIPAGSWKFS